MSDFSSWLDQGEAAGWIGKPRERFIVAAYDAPLSIRNKADRISTGPENDQEVVDIGWSAARELPVAFYGDFDLVKPITCPYTVKVGGRARFFTPDFTYPAPAIHIYGGRQKLGIVGLPATVGQGTNVLPHSTGGLKDKLKKGDYVCLTTAQGWGSRPGENHYGEILLVEDATDTLITFAQVFRTDYNLTGAVLYKYDLIQQPVIAGLSIVGVGGSGHPKETSSNRETGLVISYSRGAEMTDVAVEGRFLREGLSYYESVDPVIHNFRAARVNDEAGTDGLYEAYGVRIMGCESAITANGWTWECRHGLEANGGQGAYRLNAGEFRPINYGWSVSDVTCYNAWAAGVGDHPGASGSTFTRVTTHLCSGGIFGRGRNITIRDLTVYGGHHLVGPYSKAQGNDHAVTLGEDQRLADNSLDQANVGAGWCGTNVVISGVRHDMRGNGTPLGSTSHTIMANHPLVNCDIDLGDGQSRPTGNGVHAVGMYNERVNIRGRVDHTAAFNANGQCVVLTPRACTPQKPNGQYNRHISIDVLSIKPKNCPVVISGSADAKSPSDAINIKLRIDGLGGSMTATSPVIRLGASPNGTRGQFNLVRVSGCDVPVNAGSVIDKANADVALLKIDGGNRFADGYV